MSQINLQKIVTVVKMPGLFRLKNYSSRGYFLEPLTGGNVRFVANEKGKVLALGNIDIALKTGSINLMEVFRKMERVHKQVPLDSTDKEGVHLFFDRLIPGIDSGRVAPSHLVKILNWYNLLVKESGMKELINEKDDGLTIV